MTDWKEWFELWTLHTPDTRLKLVKNATFLEQLYDNFKERMIAEMNEKPKNYETPWDFTEGLKDEN